MTLQATRYGCVLRFGIGELPWSEEMFRWGNDTYGVGAHRWMAVLVAEFVKAIHFRTEAHAMLFACRWVGA